MKTPLLLPLIWLLLLLPKTQHAQNSINGSVAGSLAKPIPFCPIALLSANDSSLVKGSVSDSAGEFRIENAPPGVYIIKIEALAYVPFYSVPFEIDSINQLSLGMFQLRESGLNLSEVAVTVYKPLIEFVKGTVVMNVENDVLSRGNTVFDLLKRVPGVVIDAQNNITINGSSGVRFLFDDRMQQIPTPQVLDMLQGMSADLVSKIELIKNPPARYDAAGTAGLINIVTKKAKVDGYNGTISLGASQGKRFRIGPSISFNYKSKKISVFSNFSYTHRNGIDVNTLNRILTTTSGTESINALGNTQSFQRVLSGSGGIEYDLSKKTLLGFYINGSADNDRYLSDSKTEVDNSSFFNYRTTQNAINDRYKVYAPSLNVNLVHKIDTSGGEIKLRLGYANYTENETKTIRNLFYDVSGVETAPQSDYLTEGPRVFENYTAKLDLNKTFDNKINLESGLSANIERDHSNIFLKFSNQSTGFFAGDTSFYNTYRFKQDVLAAYTTLSRSWDKIGFSAGLRAEQTNVSIDYYSSDYFYNKTYLNFFPSGTIDYTINKKNNLSGTYSYRIRRPHYGMLNPVRQYNDQLNINVGNSEIRSQYAHNFTLDYSYNQFITLTAGHEQTKDFTFWYSYTPVNSRIIIDTISNLPHFSNTYLSLSLQKRIKWYSIQSYWVVTHQEFRGELVSQDVSSKTTQLYFNLNQEINLPNDFKIQIWAGRGSAIRHGPQLYHARSAIHITVNKSFFDRKLNIALGLNDVMYRDYFSVTTTYTDQNFYSKNLEDSRRIRLTLTYRFGKMQFQQRIRNENNTSGPGR